MARCIYTDEHTDYLRSISPGRFNDEITELFNCKFDFTKSKKAISSLKKNYGITSGELPKRTQTKAKLFTAEQELFLKSNAEGIASTQLTEMVNAEFGLAITEVQVKSWKARNKVSSGLTGRFEAGQPSWNKGMKGLQTGGQAGWFKKGQAPVNYKPVGTERVNSEGYTDIKVADPGTWKTKHTILWEEANGEVPDNHVLLFADGDKSNVVLENLLLVSRRQLAILNKNNLIQNEKELTMTGLLVADVYLKIGAAKNNERW